MRIRFNETLPACKFDNGKIVVELKACDQNDLLAFSMSADGFRIPDHAWVEKEQGDMKIRVVDYTMLSPDEMKAMQFNDDVFIGSRIVSISGIQNEDGENLSIDQIPKQALGDVVTLLKREYPEFMAWCQEYILGSKKKSGKLEIIM